MCTLEGNVLLDIAGRPILFRYTDFKMHKVGLSDQTNLLRYGWEYLERRQTLLIAEGIGEKGQNYDNFLSNTIGMFAGTLK